MGDTLHLQTLGTVFTPKNGICSTTKVKVSVEDVEVLKEQFLLDIKAIVNLKDISHDLILNCDQTAINYVPVSNWTMAKQGSEKVNIAGVYVAR